MKRNYNTTKQVNNSSLGHIKNYELFTISLDTTSFDGDSLNEICESGDFTPVEIVDIVIEKFDHALDNGVVIFDNDIQDFIYDAVRETVYGFLELDLDDERREYGFAYGFESDLFNMNISLSYSELNISFLF